MLVKSQQLIVHENESGFTGKISMHAHTTLFCKELNKPQPNAPCLWHRRC